MTNYDLLATDIDGTLLPSNMGSGYSIQPTQLAFDLARYTGNYITFATGRPFEWTIPIVRAFGISSPVIVNNGARVSDPSNGETLWEQPLPEGSGEHIQAFLAELAVSQNMRVSHDHGNMHRFKSLTIDILQESVYFDLIGIAAAKDAVAIAEFVEGLEQVSCAVVASPQLPGGSNILITHEEATKFQGLRKVQELLDILPDQTIAAGNDVNDAGLLAAAGLGVAVADADPRLLEVADEVIPSAWEYGLAQLVCSRMLPMAKPHLFKQKVLRRGQ